MLKRFVKGREFLLVLAAAGCFVSAPFDLALGKWGAAGFGIFLGVALLSLVPKPKRRRI